MELANNIILIKPFGVTTMSNIQKNPANTVETILTSYNSGQGKTVNPTSGKSVPIVESGFIEWAKGLAPEMQTALVAYNQWKTSNYDKWSAELTEYQDAGYINKAHAICVNNGRINPFERPSKVLTSEQYKLDRIRLNTSESSVLSALADFSTRTVPDSMTKTQLVEMIQDLQQVLFSTAEQEIFNNMVKKEEEEAAKWKTLLEAGFSDIVKTKDGYTASIAVSAIDNGIEVLIIAGYKVIGDPVFNLKSKTMTVNFVEGEPDKA